MIWEDKRGRNLDIRFMSTKWLKNIKRMFGDKYPEIQQELKRRKELRK